MSQREPATQRTGTVALGAGISVVLCLAVTASIPVHTQAPSFVSRSVEIVALPVTVTDGRGMFVTNLPRDRFSAFDNGRRQEIVFFSNEDTPASVGIVIDASGSMRPKLTEVIAAAMTFMRLGNPHDELFAIPFNDTVIDLDDGRPFRADDTRTLEHELRSLVPQGRTALYDALDVGLRRVERGTRPRKALVVLSDGGDNASRATLDEVLASARRSNVVIFTIGLFDPGDLDQNPGVLRSLAQSTGGVRFLPRTPQLMVDACERIARELRTGYTIGYVPPDRDGSYHRVGVEVHRAGGPKLTVRTRPGYFAAPSNGLHP